NVPDELDERALHPEVADDADREGNHAPEDLGPDAVTRGLCCESAEQIEYRENDERGEEELPEEALVEVPRLAENLPDVHGATLRHEQRLRHLSRLRPVAVQRRVEAAPRE